MSILPLLGIVGDEHGDSAIRESHFGWWPTPNKGILMAFSVLGKVGGAVHAQY